MQQALNIRWMVAALALAGVNHRRHTAARKPPNAAAKYVGRMSIEVQEGHPKQVAMERFAKLVSERTNGEVEIKIFPQQPTWRGTSRLPKASGWDRSSSAQ